MNFLDILSPLIKPILDDIVSFIPNPEEKQKARLAAEAALQAQSAALQAAAIQASQSQLDIDKAEAASPSLFVAGWRPAVGWVCVFGLAWQFVLQPFIQYGLNIYSTYSLHAIPPLPALDTGQLIALLMSMLGLGTMRTFEATQGVARDNLTSPRPQPQTPAQ
jgi:hypothetical protein